MTAITYSELTNENFSENSLDNFIRHQEIREIWQKINGSYVLVPNKFTEDWDKDKLREIARQILNGVNNDGFAYGAFSGNEVVGYIYLSGEFFGRENQYIELQLFHISEPFRRKGIGKELFRLGCIAAKATGAKKL